MKIGTLAIILGLTVTSCNFNRRQYSNDGISFQLPAGFRIVENSIFNSGTHYVSIEPKSKKKPGVILMTWERDSVDLQKYLNLYINSVQNGYKSEEMEPPIFSEIVKSSFAGHEAIFTSTDSEKKSVGGHQYWTFHCYYTTVMITVAYHGIQITRLKVA